MPYLPKTKIGLSTLFTDQMYKPMEPRIEVNWLLAAELFAFLYMAQAPRNMFESIYLLINVSVNYQNDIARTLVVCSCI